VDWEREWSCRISSILRADFLTASDCFRLVFYQFNPASKTVPFVTGGYSLAFRGGTSNLIHYGGGFNHWFSTHWGMRFEVRNHTQTRNALCNLLQFRVALLLR
jgi:hypothetical protein